MATKDGPLKGARHAEWLFTKAKVALAVAIIRSGAAGTSVRERAAVLARRLRSRDEGWERKARGLQQEVLRLRQEVLVAAETSTDPPEEDVSQDLFASSDETPELLRQDPRPAASSSAPPGLVGGPPHPHARFLESLCALHRVEGNHAGLEALWFGGDAGSLLEDSVCRLLDSVLAASGDPPPPGRGGGDSVPRACRAAARAMDLFCRRRLPSAEFTRRVEERLRELAAMLLHADQPGGLQEELTQHLVTLGSSSMCRSFVVRHLLSLIADVAHQLWQAFQGRDGSGLDAFPVDRYQNSCRLFWIAEELLKGSKAPSGAEPGAGPGAGPGGFPSHLERRAFLLSEEFPLFAICMWRVRGLLTPPDSSAACG